jgi:hypothetical protein
MLGLGILDNKKIEPPKSSSLLENDNDSYFDVIFENNKRKSKSYI